MFITAQAESESTEETAQLHSWYFKQEEHPSVCLTFWYQFQVSRTLLELSFQQTVFSIRQKVD